MKLRPRPLLILAGLFILSRIAYAAVGVRFDLTPLVDYWQYLDPALLGTDLLRSCFYLHSQPPAYNLFLGGVVKLGDGFGTAFAHVAYLLAGVTLYGSLYGLARRLRVSERMAVVAIALFMLSPAAILYENLLFYTYPTAAILAFGIWMLVRFSESPRLAPGIAGFACFAALGYIRSLFHIVFIVAAAVLLIVLGLRWRRVLLAALLPLLLLVALYTKNAVVFGEFSASSWMGMNLWRVAGRHFEADDRREYIDAGKMTELARLWPFLHADQYPAEYREVPEGFRDLPALVDEVKSTGSPNYNQYGYIRASKEHLDNARVLIEAEPRFYLSGLLDAALIYMAPSSQQPFLKNNAETIAPLLKAYYAVRLRPGVHTREIYHRAFGVAYDHYFSLMGLAIFLPLLGAGLFYFLRSLRRSSAAEPERVAIAMMFMTIVYVAVIGNAFECGENNRFRFVTDGFYLLFACMILRDVYGRFRPRVGPGEPKGDV